jgi:hypothetical protein
MITRKKITTSLQLSKFIEVPHHQIIKFYDKVDNLVVLNRDMYPPSVIMDEKGIVLYNITETFLFGLLCNFNKIHLFDHMELVKDTNLQDYTWSTFLELS